MDTEEALKPYPNWKDDILGQLERYGSEPHRYLLPLLWAITDLNDSIHHMRPIGEEVEAVRAELDKLILDPWEALEAEQQQLAQRIKDMESGGKEE